MSVPERDSYSVIICSIQNLAKSTDRASIYIARSMDSCAKEGSIDCAARSIDRADPQIAPTIYTFLARCQRQVLMYYVGPNRSSYVIYLT